MLTPKTREQSEQISAGPTPLLQPLEHNASLWHRWRVTYTHSFYLFVSSVCSCSICLLSVSCQPSLHSPLFCCLLCFLSLLCTVCSVISSEGGEDQAVERMQIRVVRAISRIVLPHSALASVTAQVGGPHALCGHHLCLGGLPYCLVLR